MLEEKIKHAQDVLKTAVKMSNEYYKKPIVICYSGGKDSDVLLDIAIKCLNKNDFIVLNSHTTLDAPETVYYIRDKFKELNNKGYKCIIKYPMYKGERDSFYKLCIRKKMLPTRIIRFCCAQLKEVSTPNQIACVGVRESESNSREGRNDFSVRNFKIYKSAQHVNAMIELDKRNAPYECTIIKAAKDQKDLIVNPIYNFNNYEVWEYIRENKISYNPLYDKGYKRVGCIGCPMADKNRYKQFADYPKYKLNMIRLCDILVKSKKYKEDFKTGEDLFRWWLEEDYKQIRMEDLNNEH